jgi:chemotaxis-related protein WspB
MLALILSVGGELYALPAKSVIEVVPRVRLRGMPRAPDWLAGVFAYRGHVVPVIDLCRRIEDRPCPSRVNSRIVVVEAPIPPTARCGLLAERVTEVRRLPAPAADTPQNDAGLVRATVLEGGTLIHLLNLRAVLPDREELLRQEVVA